MSDQGLSQIGAIILAAGASSRMGSLGPKPLLVLGGRTLLSWTLRALHRCAPRIIVTGIHHEAISASEASSGLTIVRNRKPEFGQLSSLQVGLRRLGEASVRGCIVALGDQPLLDDRTVAQLLHAFGQRRNAVVVPRYEGQTGHPIIIGEALFRHLLDAPQPLTMRDAIAQALQLVGGCRLEVDTADSSVLWNINSPQDLQAIRRQT